MPERTTVRLPEDLVRRAKRKAAAEGRSLTALIEDGLRLLLKEPQPARRTRRIMPPVSSATGGLNPGINLDETAALQEMDDLESVRRLR
jgi:hypothetical protein